MADLKTNNSTYDTSIDTYTPLSNTDTIEFAHINGPLSAIIAIEGKLGIGLPGSQLTLAARLTQMLASNGAIKSGTSFPTSPTPVDAQLFWRTDLKVLYIYDGALAQWQGLQIPSTFNFSSPSAFTLALYHNITAARTITFPDATDQLVARNTTDTLTNKTLTAPVISTITNTGTLTLPTTTDTLVGRATTDTLTNKTLTSPVINTPTGIVKGDVGLGNVDNTSNVTERAATATLTNKTLTAPVLSGTITGTYALNGSKVRAYRSAALVLTTGSYQIFPFDAESYDVNNDFNISTYKFTAPQTGYYLVHAVIQITSGSGLMSLQIVINTTSYTILDNLTFSASAPGEISDMVYMASGNTLEIQYNSNVAGNVSNDNKRTYLTITQVL